MPGSLTVRLGKWYNYRSELWHNELSGGADSSLTLDCLHFFVLEQKEQLKVIIGAKDREEGARGSETVKVQLRSTLVSDSTLGIPDFQLKIIMILCYERYLVILIQ